MNHYQGIIDIQYETIEEMQKVISDRDEKIKKLETENSHLQFRIGKQIKAAWGRINLDESDGPLEMIKDLEKQIDELKEDVVTFRNVSVQDYFVKVDLENKNKELNQQIEDLRNWNKNLFLEHNELIIKTTSYEEDLKSLRFTILYLDKKLSESRHQDPDLIKKVFTEQKPFFSRQNEQDFKFQCPDPKESLEYQLLQKDYNQVSRNNNNLGRIINEQSSQINSLNDNLYRMNSKKSTYLNHNLYLLEQLKLLMDASYIQRCRKQNSNGVGYDQIKFNPED